MIATLLTLGATARPPATAARVWLYPGVPVLVGPRHTLTLETSRAVEDDTRELVLRLRGPDFDIHAPLGSGAALVFLAARQLHECLPRALESDAHGRPLRALVELQRNQVMAA